MKTAKQTNSNSPVRAGMLGALATLEEDLSSVLGTHTEVDNLLYCLETWHPLLTSEEPHVVHRRTCRKTLIQIK